MASAEPATGPVAADPMLPITPAQRKRLLEGVLKGVSRAFYLTLRVLPSELREPVGLAYLLARAADTIADTRLLPPDERLKHLLAFRAQVVGPASKKALQEIESAVSEKQSLLRERGLLRSLPEAFAMLEALPQADGDRVRSIVVTLTQGMEIDLTTFPAESEAQPVAFSEPADLDRYIYYVAGCVGGFWTAITVAHSPSLQHWDVERMSQVGVRFGKALQLTNVIRDVPRDLRLGRCYLPETELAKVGLAPADLLDPSSATRARPVLAGHIELALDHYRAAEEYLLAIPRRSLRLRLAALWPVLIGLATLTRVARNLAWLDPSQVTKVTRGWVYRMIVVSLLVVFSNRLLRARIGRLRSQVLSALADR